MEGIQVNVRVCGKNGNSKVGGGKKGTARAVREKDSPIPQKKTEDNKEEMALEKWGACNKIQIKNGPHKYQGNQ